MLLGCCTSTFWQSSRLGSSCVMHTAKDFGGFFPLRERMEGILSAFYRLNLPDEDTGDWKELIVLYHMLHNWHIYHQINCVYLHWANNLSFQKSPILNYKTEFQIFRSQQHEWFWKTFYRTVDEWFLFLQRFMYEWKIEASRWVEINHLLRQCVLNRLQSVEEFSFFNVRDDSI